MGLALYGKKHLRQAFFLLSIFLCAPCVISDTAHANAQPPSLHQLTPFPQRIIATAPQPSPQPMVSCPWQRLEAGLEYVSLPLQKNLHAQLEVLRFSPKYFDFVLHSISENNAAPQTLRNWAEKNNLVAAINASMYLPDGRTSTGYMRSHEYENNKRIAKAFGVFFLAQPKDTKANIPTATLLEKNTKNFEKILQQYHIAVQNYRLISAKRNILWSANGQKHSIAAVGMDTQGNILFLHCREPIEPSVFASELLRLPLQLGPVMYVEGGAQAGMVLRHEQKEFFWGGRHPADIFMGTVGVALPNILGVVRKKTSK